MQRDETSSSSSHSSSSVESDSVSRNEINESQSKAQLLTNMNNRPDSKLFKKNNIRTEPEMHIMNQFNNVIELDINNNENFDQ